MKRALQNGVFLLCVFLSVAGAYNVLADNAEVEALAKEVACGGGAHPAPDGGSPPAKPPPKADAACRPQKTRMERTPLSQTFDFATAKHPVTVRCARSALLVGDYACELR